MANEIVTTNVSQVIAPTPSKLQQTGAVVSEGATTLAAGVLYPITQPSDYTAIMPSAKVITAATWASNVATLTVGAGHGFSVGDTFPITVTGMTPTGYNGTFAATATSSTALTVPLTTNPGLATVYGALTHEDVTEVVEQLTTYFAQGSNVAVYILELGSTNDDTAAEGIAALGAWIVANPGKVYSYLVPRYFDSAAMAALAALYVANTAKTYFHVTTTVAGYSLYAGMKSVLCTVEAVSPAISATEFTAAALFYQTLAANPSATNKVAPFAFRYALSVTAGTWANAQLVAFKANYVNYIATGAEGGISNTLVKYGTTMDGRDFLYWYSVDWIQINVTLDIANEVINGSNNPVNPLYYNQDGIDRLQARAQSTMNRAITYGLCLSPVTVTQTPFLTYTAANPSDYKLGKYNGLAVTCTPTRGFINIVFNVVVTDFVTGS